MNEYNTSVTVKGSYNKKYYIDVVPNRDMGELEIFISSQRNSNQKFKDIERAIQYLADNGVDLTTARKVISVERKAFYGARKKDWTFGANAWGKFIGHGGGGG